MSAPLGTVTFLFTDIEGSTRRWEADADAMRSALAIHDAVLRAAIEGSGGRLFKHTGDGVCAVFGSARAAVDAAVAAQRGLALPVRMGVATGEADERDGDFFGPVLNRTARIMAAAHGGQIPVAGPTAGIVTGVDLVDLGEHRLRDLAGPERLFQVRADGLRGDYPPLRTLEVALGNLPVESTSFVGREAEVAEVVALVCTQRLVTLTGVGGVGKTRLALRGAAELADDFPDGVWLVELAPASTGDEAIRVVGGALGVTQQPGTTEVESIVELLRLRNVLVVLDNCEHVLADASRLVAAVLARAPGVRVLATSREALGVSGERLVPVRSLELPADAADARSSDAVTLFVERAQAVVPDFVLDEACTAAVAEICRRLDGIPLAIELAAARVAAMGPAEIAGHLDERFRLLTGGRSGRVGRHRTLGAAVEWSYSLLAPAERTVFDRLGVFPARFDEAAAVAVCASGDIERWDVIDGLGSLVAKSMVSVVDRGGDTTRYQLLETLRHFARDRALATSELEGLRRRHATYYCAFATLAGASAMTADELVWRPRLSAEMDNLRSATGWALDAADPRDVELGVRILDGLVHHALYRPSSGIQTWASAADPRALDLDVAQRSVVLGLAAYDAMNLGLADGAALGREVIAGSDDFTPGVVAAFAAVSVSALTGGDLAGAVATLAEGQRRRASSGVDDWRAVYLCQVTSFVAATIADHAWARSSAEEALRLARRIGAPTLLANALCVHAWAIFDEDPDRALAAVDESVQLTESGAGDSGYVPALSIGAALRIAAGDRVGATQRIRSAIAVAARSGLRGQVGLVAPTAVLVLIGNDAFEAAATVGGGLSGTGLAATPGSYTPRLKERYERGLGAVAEALGGDRYSLARDRGSSMTYEEIVDYVLDQLDRCAS